MNSSASTLRGKKELLCRECDQPMTEIRLQQDFGLVFKAYCCDNQECPRYGDLTTVGYETLKNGGGEVDD